jgi:pimeloyl-ACP methyl ester carboxylesterase
MADTIVLIHGLWLTARSWEHWIPRYEAQGYRVLAPAVEEAEAVVAGLDEPPILIGHSTGGATVQALLERGHGAAGVVLNSAPTAGVNRAPLAQLRALFPALKNPARRDGAFGFSFEDFHYALAEGVDEEPARELYERYAVTSDGHTLWSVLFADDVRMAYTVRAPLLFVSGRRDRVMPPSLQRANARLYPHAEHLEIDGPHLLPVVDGWERVADHALRWAA